MTDRLEVALKPEFFDAEAHSLEEKMRLFYGIDVKVSAVHTYTFAENLPDSTKSVLMDAVVNPVTETANFGPVFPLEENQSAVRVGWRPGVKDTTADAIRDVLQDQGIEVFSGKYFIVASTDPNALEAIGNEMTNPIVNAFDIHDQNSWQENNGVGMILPQVELQHEPTFTTIPESSLTQAGIEEMSDTRNIKLNPRDIPTIISYFRDPEVLQRRKEHGLTGPTDIELEYTGQARSDHCNHNTFNARFNYTDSNGKLSVVDNLFKEAIVRPTTGLAEEKPWVRLVLDDNAGIARFDETHDIVITSETHNSPSNMEAYGGAITGIVGVYRDPMGTGRGSRLIAGAYGFCVGPQDYNGDLELSLHPRRLLEGIIEGVKDGGNKSGIPTVFGNLMVHERNIGKSLVYVTALGLQPNITNSTPTKEKYINPGDLILMCGGRVGKDGIHGVNASSEVLNEKTPAGHVQIGDPYTQKKMHDMLIEAREAGLIQFITDNGGGGLSSSVGEAARDGQGAEVYLDKVPLKYDGLDLWEIWISESQERMTVSVKPERLEDFIALSRKHDVESTVIGKFTDTEALEIKYKDKTCLYMENSFLESNFPQWEFDAKWLTPEERGLAEPEIDKIQRIINENSATGILYEMLQRPNLASKEWIARQYDHEVQGGSIIKPFGGKNQDTPSSAAVFAPKLDSDRGIALTQVINQLFSEVDTYHMTTAVIDEAIRRVLVVGGSLDELGGVDNFCWPTIQPADDNPDAEYKAAQLVRSGFALRDMQNLTGIVLLSGKDSMYCDGRFVNKKTGTKEKVSIPPTLQFTVTSIVEDVNNCTTPDLKEEGNLIYVIGETKDELGGSEFYAMLGETGLNIPQTDVATNMENYKAFEDARNNGLVASAIEVKAGGLAYAAFLIASSAEKGLDIDLEKVQEQNKLTATQAMYSESTGRMLVEVTPENKEAFESMIGKSATQIGTVRSDNRYIVQSGGGTLIDEKVQDLKSVWKSTYGDRR